MSLASTHTSGRWQRRVEREPFAAARRLAARALLVCGFSWAVGSSTAEAQELAATLNVTGPSRHAVRTMHTGASWLETPLNERHAMEAIRGGAWVLKVPVDEFGIRWDTQTEETSASNYNWFGIPRPAPLGSEGRDDIPRTFFQQLTYAADNNVTVTIEQPLPRMLVPSGTVTDAFAGKGYHWQTHDYYAAQVQFVLGTASSDWQAQIQAKRAAGLARGNGPFTSMDVHHPANAGFNWANLRAERGRVQPYTNIYGFTMGMEPYFAEGIEPEAYPGMVKARMAKIRALTNPAGRSVKLGVFLRQGGGHIWEDHLWAPGTGVDPNEVGFLLLYHLYTGFANMTFPQRIPWWLGAFNGKDLAAGQHHPQDFNADGTRHIWSGYHLDSDGAALHMRQHVDQMLVKYNLPSRLRDELVLDEWGYGIVSPAGTFDDLGNAISRAGFMVDCLAKDFKYIAVWVLGTEAPHTFGLLNFPGNGRVLKTPSWYVKAMLDELIGTTYVDSKITSPSYTHTPAIEPIYLSSSDQPVTINYVDAWVFASGADRWVFAINRHQTSAIRLNVQGLAGLNAVEHRQLGGGGRGIFDDNSRDPYSIVPRRVTVRNPLVLDALSINMIRFSTGGPVPLSTGRIWGDVTKDGTVNSADALGILTSTVGLSNPAYDYVMGDVNGDGQVTAFDALIDLHFSVGLPVSSHPVGQPAGDLLANIGGVPAAPAAPAPGAEGAPEQGATPAGEAVPNDTSGAPAADSMSVPETEVGASSGLRWLLRPSGAGGVDQIGSFHVRVKWDARRFKFRAARSAGGEGSIFAVNYAVPGEVTVAGAAPNGWANDFFELVLVPVSTTTERAEAEVTVEVVDLVSRGGGDVAGVDVTAQKIGDDGQTGGGGGSPALGLPFPNPSRGLVRIPLKGGRDGGGALAGEGDPEVEVNVYDLRGRRVKRLYRGTMPDSEGALEWDATDATGRRVPAGIYVVELRADGDRQVKKVVIF